jgi:hypothetical protein
LAAEFTVIVVGILVALLVDGWVTAAADRRLEREYLGRLEQEVGDHMEELRYISQVSAAASAYVDSLLLPSFVDSVDDSRLVTAVAWAGNGRRPDLARSTFEELVSSGRLRVIRSTAVRVALAEYDRILTETVGYWDQNPPAFFRWQTERLPHEVYLSFLENCTTGPGINELPVPEPCIVELNGWTSSALRLELGGEAARRTLRLQKRRVGGGGFIAGDFIFGGAEQLREALRKEIARLNG